MYCFKTAQDRIFIHDDSCLMNCHSHGQFCLRYTDNAVSLCCVLHAGGNILTHFEFDIQRTMHRDIFL